MSEPATPLIASGGLTVFGIVTGLHPMLLVAGFVGSWWYNSYGPDLPFGQRISSGIIASLVAAWVTPPIVAWVTSAAWWPASVPGLIVGFPAALATGFLTHKVLGPGLLKLAEKKAEEIAS